MTISDISSLLNDKSVSVCSKFSRLFPELNVNLRQKSSMLRGARDVIRLLEGTTSLPQGIYPETVNINPDGSQSSERIIQAAPESMNDENALLKYHKYDSAKFQIVSSHSSIWQQKESVTLYASKITVKPRTGVSFGDMLKMIDKRYNLSNERPKFDLGAKECDSEGNVMEIDFCDLHFGRYASPNETNGGTSMKKEMDDFDSYLRDIHSRILADKSKITGGIYLCFLGDILNADNGMQTTTNGTFQQMSDAMSDVFTAAMDKLTDCISSFRVYGVPVQVIYVPGNHDEILGFALMKAVSVFFKDDKGISFDLSQKCRKFRRYGCNLIGWVHGDGMSAQNIVSWLPAEAREDFGKTQFAEVHAAHFHSQKVKEVPGVILRHNPSPSEPSVWEYNKGYISVRAINSYVWNKDKGLQEILFHHR